MSKTIMTLSQILLDHTRKSCLRTHHPQYFCRLTCWCSSMTVQSWKMKETRFVRAAVGILTKRIWAQARFLSTEGRTDQSDPGSQMGKWKFTTRHRILYTFTTLHADGMTKQGFLPLGKGTLSRDHLVFSLPPGLLASLTDWLSFTARNIRKKLPWGKK